MNLQNYFTQTQSYHLLDETKSEIFSKIRQKRFEQIVAKSRFSRVRRTVYRGIAGVIVLGAGGFFFQQNETIDHIFYQIRSNNGFTSVSADYLAELIDIEGDWHIQHGEEIVSTPYLNNGDVLYLKSGSKITFTLSDGTKGKILGPAILSINRTSNNHYQIHLSEGQFFQISNSVTKHVIEVITDDLTVQTTADQNLDLQIAKNDTETMIKNNGDDVRVMKETKESASSTLAMNKNGVIIKQETLSIRPDDINHISDSRTFELFLRTNNISETVSLSMIEIGSESTMNVIPSIVGGELIQTGETQTQIPELSIDILSGFGAVVASSGEFNPDLLDHLGLQEQKKIPDESQQALLINVVNGFFIQNSFDRIEEAQLIGDSYKVVSEINSLKAKLDSIVTAFELGTYPTTWTVSERAAYILSKLQAKFYVSPSTLSELDKLINFPFE